MTKKQQNRVCGFAKRSLSVVLTVLLVLSTLVVMLTATSLSAGAAISYWNIAGNFNDWQNSLNNTSYRINSGSGGSVTIPMTNSSIKFKVCAYDNGWKWCGNSSGSLSVDTEGELSWNSGIDIVTALPANTVSVTFTVSVKSDKKYVKVHANTSGGGETPHPSGDNVYTAKVNENNNANSKDKIFWADATYYDYLSDKELTNGWLNPDHVGTSNFNGNIDEWYPFYNFNRNVVKKVADSNPSWSKPLYFGNFCNTWQAYDTSHHPGVANGYNDATGSSNVTRFDYPANNSNGVYDMHTSVQGLMGSTLTDDGKLQTADGTVAPYFDADSLGNNAKIVNSKFPFRKKEITDGGKKYMRYEFDSTNAKDNVYFDWSGATPTAVNYGAGTGYGVKDGIKEFMNTPSGYGIFPFNRPAGQSNGGNNQLDYGFGIRMDMKFRVPANTDVKFDFSGDDDLWMYITDTTDGTSQLVLDMGGSHKESEGVVDFLAGTSTVYKVDDRSMTNRDIFVRDYSNWGKVVLYAWGDGTGEWFTGQQCSNQYRFRENEKGSAGGLLKNKTQFLLAKNTNYEAQTADMNISDYAGKLTYTNNLGQKDAAPDSGNCKKVTTPFSFNPKHTYTMTIFYMERGLIESNCKMGFTMTPLGNNFIVTEWIDTVPVNEGLQDIVTGLSNFGFNTLNNGSVISDPDYATFHLRSNEMTEIGDSALPMRSKVKIEQFAPTNSFLTYTTVWDYYDNLSGKLLGSGTGVTSNGVTTITNENTLINEEDDDYEYAELQVNYRNTPVITNVKITKEVDNYDNLPDEMKDDEFPTTIKLKLSDDMEYTAFDGLETSKGTIDFASGQTVSLKHGEEVTVYNVPVGTMISAEEDLSGDGMDAYQQTGGTGTATDNDQDGDGICDDVIEIVNLTYEPIFEDIDGEKQLNGLNYTGDLFTFCVEGVPKFSGDSDNIVDTSAMTPITTNDVTAGAFKLGDKDIAVTDADALLITGPGVYRYHVYEQEPTNSDFVMFGNEYLVKITVSIQKINGTPKLVAGEPVFIPYSRYEDTIAAPGGAGGPVPHEMNSADFDKNPVDELVFSNTIRTGSVMVHKKNQNDESLKDVTFQVYKVNDAMSAILADGEKTEAEKYDAIMTGGFDPYSAAVTNDEGKAYFDDLQLYTDSFLTDHTTGGSLSLSANDAFDYQNYILLEASGPEDYAINKTINQFKFPINGRYDYTFSEDRAYINGTIKSPPSGGVNHIVTIGLGIILLAAVLLAAYVIVMKKRGFSFISFRK